MRLEGGGQADGGQRVAGVASGLWGTSGLGLERGGVWKFKDLPHVQIPLNKVGLTLADLQKLYTTGGYKAVFSRLDQFRW